MKISSGHCLVFVLLLSQCGHGATGGDGGGAADLATADMAIADMGIANMPIVDMSVADMAAPPFCANTLIAGSCVADFFKPIMSCILPAGMCTSDLSKSPAETRCWPNGLRRVTTIDKTTMKAHLVWTNNGSDCMQGDYDGAAKVYTLHVATAALTYNNSTHEFGCPDGSRLPLAQAYGNCEALALIISADPGPCNRGTCP